MKAYKDLELAAKRHHPVLRPTSVQIERELEVLSQLMDNQFRIPILDWRFGFNAIIDLIPEFGDIATTIVALYILVSAVRYRVPKITLLRMGVNIGIYFAGAWFPLPAISSTRGGSRMFAISICCGDARLFPRRKQNVAARAIGCSWD